MFSQRDTRNNCRAPADFPTDAFVHAVFLIFSATSILILDLAGRTTRVSTISSDDNSDSTKRTTKQSTITTKLLHLIRGYYKEGPRRTTRTRIAIHMLTRQTYVMHNKTKRLCFQCEYVHGGVRLWGRHTVLYSQPLKASRLGRTEHLVVSSLMVVNPLIPSSSGRHLSAMRLNNIYRGYPPLGPSLHFMC